MTDDHGRRHAADSHDVIQVRGARENNLRDISLDIPKRRLTVFTGVSGSGKSLAGLRHDRRRVAAPDQRDLHGVPPVVHAQSRPPGRRRAAQPQRRDRRRPGADGRQLPLHRRHRHRRVHDAADPVQPARRAARRHRRWRFQLQPARGHVPEPARASARSSDIDVDELVDRDRSRSTRARSPCPASPSDSLVLADLRRAPASSTRTTSCGTSPTRSGRTSCTSRPPRSRSAASTSPTRASSSRCSGCTWPRTGSSMQPHVRAFVDRAVTFTDLPGLRRHPAQPGRAGRPRSTGATSPTARPCRSATWPSSSAASTTRRSAPLLGTLRRHAGLAGRDRPRLPQPGPRVRHAVRRRGAAGEDGPAPRLQPHRRHLRLRRADRRACTRTTSSG